MSSPRQQTLQMKTILSGKQQYQAQATWEGCGSVRLEPSDPF